MTITADTEIMLTPAQVAELFAVHTRTLTRWSKTGRLHPITTLGGHRRYRLSEIEALVDMALTVDLTTGRVIPDTSIRVTTPPRAVPLPRNTAAAAAQRLTHHTGNPFSAAS